MAETFFAPARYRARQQSAGFSVGANQTVRTMSRNNMLYLLVGALVVAVAVIGYYEYQDRHQKQAAGLNINIGPAGIHVGGGTSK
jgi:hypothetical protein